MPFGDGGGVVVLVAAVGVVGVGVGNKGGFYGLPGIDVEATGSAVEAFGADGDQWGHGCLGGAAAALSFCEL